MGIMAAAIFNSKRTKNDQPMASPEDFMPIFVETTADKTERTSRQTTAFVAGLGLNQPHDRTARRQPKE